MIDACDPALVRMPVVQIGVVRVGVRELRVSVRMDMRLAAVPGGIVRMLVMGVMHVFVAVRQLVVPVRMLVMF